MHRRADRDRAIEQRRHLNRRRNLRTHGRQFRAHHVHHFHGVGIGLALHGEYDGARVIVPGGDLVVLDAVDHIRDLVELDRRSVSVGDHDVAIIGGMLDRAGSGNRHALFRSGQRPDRGARVCLGNHGAHVVERNVAGRRLHRIDLNAHREFLRAIDLNLGDARQLRQLRRHHRLRVVVDRRQRHGLGAQADIEHREVARIDLAERRRCCHFHRQQPRRRRQRGLYVECRAVDVAPEIELDGDLRYAERGRRTHRRDAGNRGQLPLDRRGNRRRHGLRAGARQSCRDLDGRKIHRRQRRHRQQPVGENTEHDQRRRQQRRQHRPADADFRDVHDQLPAAAFGARGLTRAPFDNSD